MPVSLEWSSSYAIGDERIDAQHRHLFKLASQAAQLKDIPQREELRELLFKLYAYVEYHFSEEEELMSRSGFPELENHREAHQEIIRNLNLIMTSSRTLGEMTTKICTMMGTWVKDHIVTVDSRLGSCAGK